MTFEQADSLAGTAEIAISAAIQVGVQIAQAINGSEELSQADRDALVARIKAAQASVPVWE